MKSMCRRLTQDAVGVESQGAVLDVEGEGVDVEVAGAHHLGWILIVERPITVHVHERGLGGCVSVHAVNQSR